MLILADKKTLFQDRYQALIMPVPVSGIFRHRQLIRVQSLYPEFYQVYRQACERSELALGEILVYETQRDLAGLGVGGALSKPKFLVAIAVTEFSENSPHLRFIKQSLRQLEPIILRWGRYEGVRRIAMLASDELILPISFSDIGSGIHCEIDSEKATIEATTTDTGINFEQYILPLLQTYLQPMSGINAVLYR